MLPCNDCLLCAIAFVASLTEGAAARQLADRAGAQSQGSGVVARRIVTVADAIEMVTLGADPAYNDGLVSASQFATFSPDGRQFVVVLKKGNIAENTNEYSLYLWKMIRPGQWTSPDLLVMLSSSSNRPAIEAIKWLGDNKTLTFLGENTRQHHQLYHIDAATKQLVRRTDWPTDLITYSEAVDGTVVLFTAKISPTSIFSEEANGEAVVMTTQPIEGLWGGSIQPFLEGVQLVYQRDSAAAAKVLAERVFAQVPYYPPILSPDGEHAILPVSVSKVPPDWVEYTDREDPFFRLNLTAALSRSDERPHLMQYVVVDTDSGRLRPLLNAPTGERLGSEAVWTADSRAAVITNTFLPLDSVSESERRGRASTRFAVEVNIFSDTLSVIGSADLHSPKWNSKDCLEFVQRKYDRTWDARTPLYFRQRRGRWVQVGKKSCTGEQLPTVALKEDMNTPPSIVIENPVSHRASPLLDMNPQFKQLQWAKEEELQWKGSNGEEFSAGLYYPPDYLSGRQYPLVVQTHGFNPARFWITGPYSGTAFAAQPLAATGAMVVQLDMDDEDIGSSRELEREADRIESAIRMLVQRNVVDPNRIGIIGFSRTCLFTKYVLTHSGIYFAAATTADGVDDGYFQYILENDAALQRLSEEALGAAPFGKGLQFWLLRSPGFNLDRVQSPLRIEALNPHSALFQWEWFAGLRRVGKPVEMIVIKDGEHILRRPWDRLVSQQGNVDWFRFWLQGYEDPDPAKVEQYRRWENLCDMQRDQSPDRPTFCVSSKVH